MCLILLHTESETKENNQVILSAAGRSNNFSGKRNKSPASFPVFNHFCERHQHFCSHHHSVGFHPLNFMGFLNITVYILKSCISVVSKLADNFSNNSTVVPNLKYYLFCI